MQVEDDKPATTSKNIAESRNILPSENAVTENIDYDEKVYDDYEEKSSPTIRSTSADTTARVDTTTPITVSCIAISTYISIQRIINCFDVLLDGTNRSNHNTLPNDSANND